MHAKLASIEEQKERALDLFLKSGRGADFVGQKLNTLEGERAQVAEAVAERERERDQLTSEMTGLYESKEQIKALVAAAQRMDGAGNYELRSQIAARLKSLISVIFIAPVGSGPMVRKARKISKKKYVPNPGDDRRYFLVRFKNRSVRWVFPTDDDPLQFRDQLVGSREMGIKIVHGPDGAWILVEGPDQPNQARCDDPPLLHD
jgi:hypothetical protein